MTALSATDTKQDRTFAADWQARLLRAGNAAAVARIGAGHWVQRQERGPKLLVSFHRGDQIADMDGSDLPTAWRVAEAQGWSHLALIADGPTWFRDRKLWSYFDRLIDEDYFAAFEDVVFFGAGSHDGYAACAYSVAAPGARVVAVRPAATLAPAIAGWDRRFKEARAMDFVSRFGYAPDMTRASERVFLIYDPEIDEDAMHAALFRSSFTERLECRHLGPQPELGLEDMGLTEVLILGGMRNDLTAARWRDLWRARRDSPIWIRNVAAKLAEGSSRICEGVFLREALKRGGDKMPRIQRRYGEVQRQLDAQSLQLPPSKR